jgi:hypothetical protein
MWEVRYSSTQSHPRHWMTVSGSFMPLAKTVRWGLGGKSSNPNRHREVKKVILAFQGLKARLLGRPTHTPSTLQTRIAKIRQFLRIILAKHAT